MTNKKNCPQCSNPMPAHSGKGRPRRYCSEGCSRIAASRIKRLEAVVRKLESDYRSHQREVDLGLGRTMMTVGAGFTSVENYSRQLRVELDQVESELHGLLA